MTDKIHISMEISNFTKNFKDAHVRPLLKNIFSSKRTEKLKVCSHLEFQKKRDKVIASRVQAHTKITIYSIYYNQLKGHIRESALLKVHNYIIVNMEKGKVTALTLLDLPAAFDTTDHATLTERLYIGMEHLTRLKFEKIGINL